MIADEQFLAAKSVVDVPDEQSSMPMLATPVDFNGEPPRPRFRAPHPGEHTREILAELQLPADEIEALVDSGVAIAGTTEAADRPALRDGRGVLEVRPGNVAWYSADQGLQSERIALGYEVTSFGRSDDLIGALFRRQRRRPSALVRWTRFLPDGRSILSS